MTKRSKNKIGIRALNELKNTLSRKLDATFDEITELDEIEAIAMETGRDTFGSIDQAVNDRKILSARRRSLIREMAKIETLIARTEHRAS